MYVHGQGSWLKDQPVNKNDQSNESFHCTEK